MNKPLIKKLSELKKTDYKPESVKKELSRNLENKLKSGTPTFEFIHGYENTVIPDLERALLSGHNINLLGLRGQAKTKLARQLIFLLDEWVPIIKGSEINEDPLNPISYEGKKIISEKSDDTPIDWIHRSERFFEKLATPDVTVSDLIGDIDPIKAANLRLSYSDERSIHFGMIPRAHRSIFVLNELPDLQARIQVSLFSILEEKEIQIRGFKIRLPIDIQFIFTANPEDYTNRGSIVTPLKDRIGSQILTHYPLNINIAKRITKQESNIKGESLEKIYVPEIAKDLIEQIGFEAKKSEFVDLKSGVSARLSISAYENLISTARRRLIINGEKSTSVRLTDFLGTISSINGKIELVYEGELEGADQISFTLINNSILKIFNDIFPEIKKLKKEEESTPYDEILLWFNKNDVFIGDDFTDKEYKDTLESIVPLSKLIEKYCSKINLADDFFHKEIILWGLSANKQLSKNRSLEGIEFKDSLGSFLNNI
tara:strand:- start:83 stop:1543 length:1461 start_codon:yes stop_codon:yes gene_type:complete